MSNTLEGSEDSEIDNAMIKRSEIAMRGRDSEEIGMKQSFVGFPNLLISKDI